MPAINLTVQQIKDICELLGTEILDIYDSNNSGPEDLELALRYNEILEEIARQRSA